MTARATPLDRDAGFWDRIARKYATDRIADEAGYERTLARMRDLLRADHRVLELGCGTGSTALRLAGAVSRYIATDLSPSMIAIAEEKLAAAPCAPLSFRVATAETLASEAVRYDRVMGFNYLHLVRDLPGTLHSILDLLAPGGLFVSKTACLGDMNPLIRLALPAMRMIGKAPHVTVFTAATLEREVRAAGFEIIAVERHATKGRDTRPFIVARRA